MSEDELRLESDEEVSESDELLSEASGLSAADEPRHKAFGESGLAGLFRRRLGQTCTNIKSRAAGNVGTL